MNQHSLTAGDNPIDGLRRQGAIQTAACQTQITATSGEQAVAGEAAPARFRCGVFTYSASTEHSAP